MKKFTKMLVLSLATVMTLGLGSVAEAKGKEVQITKPSKKAEYTIKRDEKNKKVQLRVKGYAKKKLNYKTSNKKVVAVNKTGMMTIKKAGKATITVTSKADKSKSDKITITVKQNVTKITAKVKKSTASFNNVVTVQKGSKYQINAKVQPAKASNKKLTYKSSKKKVATVSSTGKITAKKVGKTKITIAAKDGSKEKLVLTVFVTKKITKKVESVTAEALPVLLAGETANIKTTVAPADATFAKVAYKSSNEKVAKVDALTGKVTAVAEGTAVITVKALDGSKKSTTVNVTVGKEYKQTVITPAQTTATVKVTFNGDKAKAAADAEKLILAAVKEGASKEVTINGNTDKVYVVNGKVVVGESKTPLADYVANKTAKDDVVTVTYGTNAAKAVAAIEVAKFTATGTYTYDITVDDQKITSLVVAADGIKLTVNGTTYDADVVGGVITVEGDVTNDAAIKYLTTKKFATVTTKTVRR